MILCGTDLSLTSDPVARAAAALARKHGQELLLVHVLEHPDSQTQLTADVRLEQEAGELRRTFETAVETLVVQGAPDKRLLEVARERDAKLLVVGADGSSQRARRLGSVTEHLCQTSPVPVLVVRNADSLTKWSQGAHALRTLVGSGLGDASRSALVCIGQWPDLALTVAHVAWPYGEHYRLGVTGPMPLDHLRPEVHHQLLGDLGRWAAEVPCRSAPKLRVVPGWGRIDSHLAQLALEKEADLLVVGTHQRNRAQRVWHGSVSRNAIHEATCNVLCVPQNYARAHLAPAPRVIVVPTDFSSLADRAIPFAYSLLEQGGSLHLVHVTSGDQDRAAALAELEARIPQGSRDLGVETIVTVLEPAAAWLAIWQYAGRVSAQLICMATHSRDATANIVLGSQAQAILQHSRIPVLLVPPDRES
jgi:nucleotide-binding universal stress UspA family protein